jgi:hypothetical protein
MVPPIPPTTLAAAWAETVALHARMTAAIAALAATKLPFPGSRFLYVDY